VTAIKSLQSLRTGPYATLDLSIASTPANSFITDIAQHVLHGRAEWLPSATWVALLHTLGISATNARTALHRMSKAGYLERSTRDGRAGHGLTQAWQGWLAVGSRAAEGLGSDDAWTLLTFSIPEERRPSRHAMRTLLLRNGFAPLGNGTWIAPSRRSGGVHLALQASGLADYADVFRAEYEGTGSLTELVRRCWDVDAVSAMYRAFIASARKVLRRAPAPDARSFAGLIVTSNRWRRISNEDPLLPPLALPDDWPRDEAAAAHDEVITRLRAPARAYVEAL
jgi:phenylacetic acid degradation operon negative regulatory protein